MIVETAIPNKFFSPDDTLGCGQVFRYRILDAGGYLVLSADKACILGSRGKDTVFYCDDSDWEYFYNYFDLARNYSKIYEAAQKSGFSVLKKASDFGKGIRILNQDRAETVISFMISQNNNIPRIQKTIESLCRTMGERREFEGEEYYTFPKISAFLQKDSSFYAAQGLGYRAPYFEDLNSFLSDGWIKKLSSLKGDGLKRELLKVNGIGDKVADCICLFGFHRTDSFPVDTWMEKLYYEDFSGELKGREKISAYFKDLFGENAGYFQQYLFYFKRSLQKSGYIC